jgi:hypothetical protein
MNGSFRCSWFTLGSSHRLGRDAAVAAALAVIAAGCGAEQKQAQAQAPAQSFEAQVPEGQLEYGTIQEQQEGGAAEQPPRAAQPGMEPGHEGMHGQKPQGEHGWTTPPGAAQGETGEGAATEEMSEKELCMRATQGATIRVQNIERGVRIEMVPKAGTDLSEVRDTAQRIEAGLDPAAPAPRADQAEQCRLFDIAALGVDATLQEGPNRIHLLLVADDPADVEQIRQRARELAGTGQQGGTPGGQ